MRLIGQKNIWESRIYMMDFKNMNDNVISRRWKQRYAEQPSKIRYKLDRLDELKVEEYQLQVIKKTREYPKTGDIFRINPKNDLILYGVVINNYVNNINGQDLLLILIFKDGIDIKDILNKEVKHEHLLIPPQIVGKEYWSRGYFYNIDHIDEIGNAINYGFYSIGKGKFFDEYGNGISCEPQLLGTYGVSTISGIARKINQELIISEIL